MKCRMFWFIVAIGFIILCACLEHATAATANPSTVYATLGPLSLPIPWDNVNVVYLYAYPDKKSEVGGEMVFAQLKVGSYKNNPVDIDLTAGGVLIPNTSAVGTGFAGVNIALPNPVPAVAALNTIQPGLFGGYDINEHRWEFGLKAAINIFNGS